MQFILTGFTQETGFRVFAFEGVAADRSRTPYRVKADLGLIRRYGISIQELPLLCRMLLESRGETGAPQHTLTYTEEDMCVHASGCAAARAAAELKRKAPRRPPATNGSAWRAPMGAR